MWLNNGYRQSISAEFKLKWINSVLNGHSSELLFSIQLRKQRTGPFELKMLTFIVWYLIHSSCVCVCVCLVHVSVNVCVCCCRCCETNEWNENWRWRFVTTLANCIRRDSFRFLDVFGTFLGRFGDVCWTFVGRLLDVSQHSRRFPAVPLIGRPKAPLGFDECGR